MRWGIEVIVGESFAEIFYGNCVAIGVPCCKVAPHVAETLLKMIEEEPKLAVRVNLEDRSINAGGRTFAFDMPEGVRQRFLTGRWDSTAELLEAAEQIRTRAKSLGYFTSFED